MDCADRDLEKTSDIKREAMVGKLHNMQWLKNTSHSSNLGKTKIIEKQMLEHDENKKTENEDLLTKNSKTNLIEEVDKCCLTVDMYKKDLSSGTMPENKENKKNRDANAANIFGRGAQESDKQECVKEKTLSIVVENTKSETQRCIDNKDKYQVAMSHNNVIDNTCVVHSNPSDTRKADQDTNGTMEPILQKHSDGNNNHSKQKFQSILKTNVQKITQKVIDVENSKVSMEAKDKDVCISKTANATKTNIKDGDFSKPSTCVDNCGKVDRFNNKHTSMEKDTCVKEYGSKPHNVLKSGTESKTKNVNAKLSPLKIYSETESNKTGDIVCKSDQKIQHLSYNGSSNKDKALQKQQQTIPKQFVSKSKGQESLKQGTSTLNRTADKNKKKMDEVEHTFTSSNLSLTEFEKKSERLVGGKNFQCDQRANRNGNLRRNAAFVTQYKNSTFSKPMQNRNMSGSVECTVYGRNSSYVRNNTKYDRGHISNVERKDVKGKRENVAAGTSPKSDKGNEELYKSNSDSCAKQQNEINDVQLTNVKSTDVHQQKTDEIDTVIFNNINHIDSVEVKTHLIENEKFENLNVDCAKNQSAASELDYDKEETSDMPKVDPNQQCKEANNKEINASKHFNLYSAKSVVKSQVNLINQDALKPENVRQADSVNQSCNNGTTWDNNLSDYVLNTSQRNSTFPSTQPSMQDMHLQQTMTQTGNQMQEMDYSKFYGQFFPVNGTMGSLQVSNTFDATAYQYNVQATTGSSAGTTTSMLETTTDNNIESSNVLHRYTPNIQHRSVTSPQDFTVHPVSSQTNRWNPPMQDIYHVEQLVNAGQPLMQVYSSGTYGTDDFNNTHVTNCPSHPVLYTPALYMQAWNPQLQYSMPPVFHNSPCMSYTMFPNMANQPNNYNDVAAGSIPMHDQQHKYVHHSQMNNNFPNTNSMQTHVNPNYIRGAHNGDPSNYNVEARNAVGFYPMKSTQYYKRYQDNYQQTVYDVPQYAPSVSYSRPPQQTYVPATGINQCNLYYSPNQKYHKQNSVSYTQPSKNPKGQRMQDIMYDDNRLTEDIPPIISPKEFVTNGMNFPKKIEQFSTRVFKPEFKAKSNTGYRAPPMQRYDGGFYRNIAYQDASKEYTSSINRGMSKIKKYEI